jgi:hypothetical protein
MYDSIGPGPVFSILFDFRHQEYVKLRVGNLTLECLPSRQRAGLLQAESESGPDVMNIQLVQTGRRRAQYSRQQNTRSTRANLALEDRR